MINPKNNDWFKPKCYLHLTPRLFQKDFFWVSKFVSDYTKIKNYHFYPLIHRTVIQPRYKKCKDESGNYYYTHHDKVKNKSTAKERHIFYAAHLDTMIYSYYAKEILGPLYEEYIGRDKKFSHCIAAYRKIKASESAKPEGKSNIHFAKEVFDFIKNQDNCVALTFDIEQFFDTLNHDYLKGAWAGLLGNTNSRLPADHYNIFRSLTQFYYVEESDLINELDLLKIKDKRKLRRKLQEHNSYCKSNEDFRERICGKNNKKGKTLLKPYLNFSKCTYKSKGIPQGTAISAFLANLYLLEFDKRVYKEIETIGGLYKRYSDDIIIVCHSEYENEIIELVESEINKFHLKINSNKTTKSYFTKQSDITPAVTGDRLRYLGFEYSHNKATLKSSALAKYYRRMKYVIKRKCKKVEVLKRSTTEHKDAKLWTNHIYSKYSYRGKRNFISYALKASDKVILEPGIKKQINKHRRILHSYINQRRKLIK
jgi:hypothetical protein